MLIFRFKRLNVIPLFMLLLILFLSGCSHNDPDSLSDSDRDKLNTAQPILSAKSQLVPLNGTGRYLVGANYPWHRYGDDFGGTPESTDKDWQTISHDFAAMQKQHIEVARVYVFADGRSEPKFDSHGYVTGLGPQFLPDLDKMLKIASDNNIALILTLCDSSMFHFYADPKMQGKSHSSLIMQSTPQQSFLTLALKPLLQHISHGPYMSTILAIDLVNEPEVCTAGFWSSVGVGRNSMIAFLVSAAEYVHTYAKGIYVTVGSASPAWVSTWRGVGVDFYCAHYYPTMDTQDLLAGTIPPGNGLLNYSDLGVDRPCVLEEFPSHDAAYEPGNKGYLSATWYMDTIRARGYAGALAWSYTVPDSASDWKQFSPTYQVWYQKHRADLWKLGTSSK